MLGNENELYFNLFEFSKCVMIFTSESYTEFLSIFCSDRQRREMDSEKVSSEEVENALDRIREWVISERIIVDY